jgi:hypothetical protein
MKTFNDSLGISKEELIKSLDELGHRESALLLKNWGELDSTSSALIKAKVNPEAFSSPAIHENPVGVEGAAKERKYQGGDPRHYMDRGPRTKAGDERVQPERGGSKKARAVTTGTSEKRGGTPASDYSRKETVEARTGKKVPWHQ